MWSDLLFRLRAVLRRDVVETELDAELLFHVTNQIKKYLNAGMTYEEAARRVRLDFGGLDQVKEDCRDVRGISQIDVTRQDLRYALRSFARNPILTLVVIMTLAVGIGGTTAIFSVVNNILVQRLPYRNSDRYVQYVRTGVDGQGEIVQQKSLAASSFIEWARRSQTLQQISAYFAVDMTIQKPDQAIRLSGWYVTPSLFEVLGAQPLLGRTAGMAGELVLSYTAWTKYFGNDAGIVGQSYRVGSLSPGPNQGDLSYSIVGVMPSGFGFPAGQPDFWTPFLEGTGVSAQTIAVLRVGVSRETAVTETRSILESLPKPPRGGMSNATIDLIGVKEEFVEPVRPALLVLSFAVGLVLLIACANVANLLLAQTVSRRREVAIRVALGAGNRRLIRQVLTESLLLALAGGSTGVCFAMGTIHLVKNLGIGILPRVDEVILDMPALAFTLGVTVLTGILFGLVPALCVARTNQMEVMRVQVSTERRRFRTVLVALQFAIATMLLIGAGLLARSFVKLINIDSGYDPHNLLTFQVPLPVPQTGQLLQQLQNLPGVLFVGAADTLPSTAQGRHEMTSIAGLPVPVSKSDPVWPFVVSSEFLKAMGMRIRLGRGFDENIAGTNAALVNQTIVRRYFAGESPIGKMIRVGGMDGPVEIIGVVDDIRKGNLEDEPQSEVYLDMRQRRAFPLSGGMYYAVRTKEDPTLIIPEVRSALRQIDSHLPLVNVVSMDVRVSVLVARPRFNTALLGFFATVALSLAVVGIYGVLVFVVSQRTREIGLRMSLGARRRDIMLLVFKEGMAVASVGILLGLVLAAGLTHYLSRMLYGVEPTDPTTFIGIPLLFVCIALVACYVPALRAMKVDPLIALRSD